MRLKQHPSTRSFGLRIVLFLLLVLAIVLFVFIALQKHNTEQTVQSPAPSLQPPVPTSSRLLPGELIWKNGVSSYLFGTNNTNNWSSNNIETNTVAQHYLHDAHMPLMRTWFFSPYGYASNLGNEAETDKRLQVNAAIGAQCLGVLQDTNPVSAPYYKQLVQHVGHRCLIYEFGNEPGANGQPGIEHYIQYWNALIPQLRKINPQAKFGGPVNDVSDIQTFLTATKRSGVLPDFVSFHDYNADPTAYGREVSQAKQLVKSILGYELPVGITEFNYACCSSFNADAAAFETQYFTAAYNGLIAAHADFATEFDSLNHGGDDELDMFNASTQPRGVYTVIKNMVAQYSTVASSPDAGSRSTPSPGCLGCFSLASALRRLRQISASAGLLPIPLLFAQALHS
jgi:hypothetical protein